MWFLVVSAASGLLAILIALYLFLQLKKATIDSARMREIAGFIAVGVRAYLSRQLRTILFITPFVAAIVWYMLGPLVALTFVLGVLTSLATAFIGMGAAVRANVRTAEEAGRSPRMAFHTAVFGGSVMGFAIIGFSILVLSVLYYIFRDPQPLIGFGFGASLAALFAQIGGGIYTKSADVGADLVGKIEQNIPEDDPRNPAVVADLVGDNVGDCSGRGSDLFQTLSDDIVTGMVVSLVYLPKYGPLVLFFPLLQQSMGLLSSIIGVFSIRAFRKSRPEQAFNQGMLVTAVVATIGSLLLAKYLLNDLTIFLASFLGILITLVAAVITRWYAGSSGRPVQNLAAASRRGVSLSLIMGLAYGLQSPVIPVMVIVVAVCIAFRASGSSLLAVVAVNIGTDLLIGYIMTADAYGPIIDNAAGIAEMSGSDPKVISALSSLDAVGNTMKATTKAYAMSSGTITSFFLFATFFAMVGLTAMDLATPYSIAFLFAGLAMPFLISSLVIGSVAKTAVLMVDEVRCQFAKIKGLLEGTANPDYASCVDIATRNALREMVLPGLVSIVVPVAVGFAFGAWALGALLIGAVAGSALLGPFFNNTGTAWDNAKKIVEEQGQKGSCEYQAAVAADTVGDPLKDVAGPSLLIFMKLIGMVSLLIANSIR